MSAMDARRLRLYELLKPKLDEEPARELVLALGPPPEEVATKDFLREQLRIQTAELSLQLAELGEKLTWRMITVMGAWTAIGASLFALLSNLLR